MKKVLLMVIMAMTAISMVAQTATFEDNEISPMGEDTIFTLDSTGLFQSGRFMFMQDVADYGEAGTYYYGFVVSNQTSTTYDYYADSYNAACGHAYDGDNYAVWCMSFEGKDYITLTEPGVVDGFYINNTTWGISSMRDGDAIAGAPFDETDWLKLTIYGLWAMDTINSVDFYLAHDGVMITEWTWVDLSSLGEVDELQFQVTGSRTGEFGLNTPGYFCMDNLNVKDVTALETTTHDAPQARKVMTIQGMRLVVNGQVYDAQGNLVD